MKHEPSLFMTKPAAFRIKENVAHVLHADGIVRHSMSIADLAISTARARRALDRHARGERDIIEDS